MTDGAEAFVYGVPRWVGQSLEFPFESRSPGADVAFTEVVEFDEALDVPATSVLVQLLHAAIGLSYYKARPAPVILGFPADPRVAPFLAELIRNGLAEYAHTSGRRDALTPSVSVPTPTPAVEAARRTRTGVLVPLGGGKDSVVSVDLLQQAGEDVHAFAVGGHPTIRACAAAAGVPLTVATRTLDPGLAAFTARTGLNGHIPVTAINSLVALLYAEGHGIGAVAMSNEGSADEPTLVTADGLVVNHQWSKSTAFERLLQGVLPDGLGYFSLLRPWHEIQIARRFAEIGTFDTVAISCNNVYLRDPARRAPSWCLRCPKCAFVGLVLAPFMPPERRARMFGGDVVGSEAMSENLRSLVGLTDGKPLECVGEVLESRAALLLLARTGEALPDFVEAVHRELEAGDLMPTEVQVERLFRADATAVAALPERYRGLLDPVGTP
ncbi:hypothetical protein ACXR2U_19035 [Jatrophihabitans sp. YIM 134969]